MKRLLLVGICGSLLLSSCGGATKSASTDNKSSPTPVAIKNVLTDLPGSNGPILAVKVDDTRPAHPQIGLESADIVYVEQVEGGLTRLAAIYSQTLPRDIGPVRSARVSDLDILAQYGRVGFAFSGAQALFYPRINAANLVNLSADRNSEAIYYRDNARFAPTNLILRPQALMDLALKSNPQAIDIVKPIGFTFGTMPNVGSKIVSAKVRWPAADYEISWSAADMRWHLGQDGLPDVSASGITLGGTNIIIQHVAITPSEYKDKFGGVTPFSNTVGTGTAYLLRDGKAISISWSRPDALSGTTWTMVDGTPANLNPGQTWIMLTDTPVKFVYPAAPSASASAPASPSK